MNSVQVVFLGLTLLVSFVLGYALMATVFHFSKPSKKPEYDQVPSAKDFPQTSESDQSCATDALRYSSFTVPSPPSPYTSYPYAVITEYYPPDPKPKKKPRKKKKSKKQTKKEK